MCGWVVCGIMPGLSKFVELCRPAALLQPRHQVSPRILPPRHAQQHWQAAKNQHQHIQTLPNTFRQKIAEEQVHSTCQHFGQSNSGHPPSPLCRATPLQAHCAFRHLPAEPLAKCICCNRKLYLYKVDKCICTLCLHTMQTPAELLSEIQCNYLTWGWVGSGRSGGGAIITISPIHTPVEFRIYCNFYKLQITK